MKKTLASLVASLVLMGSAVAADLPKRTAPAAPVPAVESFKNWYVGGTFGGAIGQADVFNTSRPSIGVLGGYQYNRNFGAELTYDYFFQGNGANAGQTVFANGVAGYPIAGTIFTPYALAGVGYGWEQFGNTGLFNVGAGLRTRITSSFDFDVRYRYINSWEGNRQANVVTGGINYKF